MSDLSARRWANGMQSFVGLLFVGAILGVAHATMGVVPFLELAGLVIGSILGVIFGIIASVYVLGVLTTDVPRLAGKWL